MVSQRTLELVPKLLAELKGGFVISLDMPPDSMEAEVIKCVVEHDRVCVDAETAPSLVRRNDADTQLRVAVMPVHVVQTSNTDRLKIRRLPCDGKLEGTPGA